MESQNRVFLLPLLGQGKKFLSIIPRKVECVSKYIILFFFKEKHDKKTKKAKETKEEKVISVENLTGYDEIFCEFALCTLTRVVHFSWLFLEFNVVYV